MRCPWESRDARPETYRSSVNCQILAPMRFGETAGGIIAEIAHMGFPDHRLRKRHVRHMVAVPTIRIGAAEVHDHAAPAVHTGPARPRVGDAVDGTAIAFDQKVVIHAVHVVGEIVRPGTIGFRTHRVSVPISSVAALPPWSHARTVSGSPSVRKEPRERTGCRFQ